MKNILLTIALTIYEPKKIELENYFYSINELFKIYKENNKKPRFQFLIISDNPDLPEETENFILKEISSFENTSYVSCKENLVRNLQVYKNLDKLNGKFLKIADPDDYLNPEDTYDLIEENLSKLTGNELIIHSYNRVYTSPINHESINLLKHNIFFKEKSYNPNSIYPIKIFKQINWDFKMMIWSDDLLGFMHYIEKADFIHMPDVVFYVNAAHNGVSKTKTKHTNLRYYNDSLLFLEKTKELILKEGYIEENIKMFKKITGKTSFWFYNQILNDLHFLQKTSRFKKISMMRKLYKVASFFEKENNEFKWIKLKTYIWLFFNKQVYK